MGLTALALNCTLKPSPADSSTDLMISQVAELLGNYGIHTETVRVADYDVRPGVTHDEGQGDQWPVIREKVKAADIVIFATPVWMGAPSSVSKRVAERLDAFISEVDDHGRMPTFGKVALVAVVGNEDGAHHVSAEFFQWFNDVGFTVPATAAIYWVGEAMGATDYKDLPEIPEKVKSVQEVAVANTVHLATLLKEQPYPGAPA